MVSYQSRSLDSANQSPDMQYLIPYYLTLHIIGGHVGLPLLVIVLLLSHRVRRPPAVTNMLITWILYSISFCLSLYTGLSNSRHPPFALCLLQAALIHATPTMCVISTCIVVIQVWYLFQLPWHPWLLLFSRLPPKVRFLMVVVPPYLAMVVVTIASVMIGLHNRSSLTASLGLYCTIDLKIFFASVIFCAACMFLILIFNAGILLQYYWRQRPVSQFQTTRDRGQAVNVGLRVLAFNLYVVITLSACLLYLVSASNPLPYMIQAGLPVAVVLIFGSQADIIRILFFRQCFQPLLNSDRQEPSSGGWSEPTEANPLTSNASQTRRVTQLSSMIYVGTSPSLP